MASLKDLSVTLSLDTVSFSEAIRAASESTAGFGAAIGTITTGSSANGYVVPQSGTADVDNTAGQIGGTTASPYVQTYPIVYGEFPGYEAPEEVMGTIETQRRFELALFEQILRDYWAPDREEVLATQYARAVGQYGPRSRPQQAPRELPRRAICLDGEIPGGHE